MTEKGQFCNWEPDFKLKLDSIEYTVYHTDYLVLNGVWNAQTKFPINSINSINSIWIGLSMT